MKYGSESCLLVYKWDTTPFYYKIVVVESGRELTIQLNDNK